jgi:choline-glycine betaine transporter
VEEEEAEEEAEAEVMEVHCHPIYSRNPLPHYIDVLFVVCTVMGLTTSVQVKV